MLPFSDNIRITWLTRARLSYSRREMSAAQRVVSSFSHACHRRARSTRPRTRASAQAHGSTGGSSASGPHYPRVTRMRQKRRHSRFPRGPHRGCGDGWASGARPRKGGSGSARRAAARAAPRGSSRRSGRPRPRPPFSPDRLGESNQIALIVCASRGAFWVSGASFGAGSAERTRLRAVRGWGDHLHRCK
jgi:hypothetical protein